MRAVDGGGLERDEEGWWWVRRLWMEHGRVEK